ncbi:MAG: topoisomerase [Phycisphaerales bacterium]|nr:topoisomerase [Phycisphaerales bacterium]
MNVALPAAPPADPVEAAESAGLIYISDVSPGISRKRRGEGFAYLDARGKPVRDRATLGRIKALVIPPAWEHVWICSSPRGHIQAVGRDERGRKQYRYHDKFRAVRDETKYARMMQFVRVLPRIRRRVARDLCKPGLLREKVLAAVVRLLETTLIRVGNEEYAEKNRHYGLTTLHNRHADVHGSTVSFHFRGKSGVKREVDFTDPRIARIVRKCQELPGEELFGYVDEEGNTHDIRSTDVNDYLREITGEDYTAKDFRTWAGTVLAATALGEFEQFDSQTQAKRNVVQAIEQVARRLGNTRAVCRKCYIHPAILEAYLDGELMRTLAHGAETLGKQIGKLPAEEAAVVVLLQRRLKARAMARGKSKTDNHTTSRRSPALPAKT